MGAFGLRSDLGRHSARVLIALAVAVATVLVPIGGLPHANAEFTDLPDQTWGVIDRGRSITTSTPSEVMAIEQIGNTIYAGGQFRTVVRRRATDPQFSQPFLAAFDATTGDWIDWWRPQFNGPIFSLEASADGSRLYVGGEFTEVNGHPGTAGIVALDPATGRIDHTWTPHIENAFSADSAAVRTIRESEGWLYIGGAITHATGNTGTRTRLWKVGRLSLTDGTADANWRPVVKDGSVWGLDHDPVRDRVYLAGYFETVNDDTPTDKFAVVNDTDGDTILGLNRFPELTPTQDHQFEVIVHGDYVWVAGTQHLVHMLNASDLSINRRWFTGFEPGYHIGGDYQALGIVGDAMFATCHCWGVIRELPNWVTTLSQADDIQPLTDEVQGIHGFDLATGDYISSNWDPDILGQIGGWAVHGAPDGCLWAGGDFNRRSIGDQWRNGLVRWCDEAGQGPPAGPPLTEQPPPETNPPSVPGNVTATDNGDGTATISWTASSDDTAVVYYRVYRDGFMVRATKDLTLTDLTPTPGDSYTVRAVDPYDNESNDSTTATPNLAGLLDRAVHDGFDGNDGGFTFVDDVFNGTSYPEYADGKVRRDGGQPDGNMMVILGGVDNDDLLGFSGAFEKTFNMAAAGDVQIDLMYKLDVKSSFENDEYGQAVVAIDGIRLGAGGYLAQINGGGSTGWVNYTTTMTLGAGSHTLQIGAYQNKKTQSSEFTEVSYDNVSITPLAPSVGFTTPAPGASISGTQAFELRASSIVDPSSALTVEVSTDGGNNWSPTTWNAASERFDFSFDTTSEPDGPLTLDARVTDTSARTGTGAETFMVNNDEDPTIAITNPTNGSNVTGVVTVRVTANDNDPAGSLNVEVSVDGGNAWNTAAWNGSQYTWDWDTSINGDGPATVNARVTDSGGTTVNATPVNVTVGSGVNYADEVLSDGAVTYWRLGDAGGTAVDETGGEDGTYVGSPSQGAPALISSANGAVDFDGVDDIVHLPDSSDTNIGGPYETKTMEAWFKADDVTTRQVIYEQGATSRGANIYIRQGSLYAGAWNRTSHAGDPTTPWAGDVFVSTPINPGVTYHVVAVFDFPSDTFSLYVNGVLADSASGLGRLHSHGGDAGIGAMRQSTRFDNGGGGGGDKNFFNGVIDEVATYNVALSAADAASHYTIGGPTADYASTVAADGAGVHWRLGESSGTNAADALGGNDATYVGSPGLGTSGVIVDPDTAVSFDGSNDMVAINDSSDVNLGGPYHTWSVELWFNADDVNSRGVLYEQGATSRGFNIYVMNGNLYAGAWNVTDNGHPSQPWGPVFLSTPVSTGTVYHAVLVFDYPNDTLELFVNGSLTDSASGLGQINNHGGDAAIGAMNDSARFHDGGKAGGDNWYFDGVIDEVALYPAALSGSVVANHYTVGLL